MLFGICGGLAEYFGVDSTLVRLAVIVLFVFWPPLILAYVLSALMIPKKKNR